MKLEYNQVAKTLISLGIRFPSAGYTPDQLKLLAREWCEDLQGEMCAEDFDAAIKLVRKQVKFFPSVAEVIEAATSIKESNAPYFPAVAYHRPAKIEAYTEEDWQEANRVRLEMKPMLDSILKRIEEKGR